MILSTLVLNKILFIIFMYKKLFMLLSEFLIKKKQTAYKCSRTPRQFTFS